MKLKECRSLSDPHLSGVQIQRLGHDPPQRSAELRQRSASLMSHIEESHYSLDREWNFAYIDRKAAEFLSLDPHRVIGASFWEVAAPLRGTRFEDKLRYAVRSRRILEFEHLSLSRPGSWVTIKCIPFNGGLDILFRDVTRLKTAEREVNELTGRLLRVQDEERRQLARELHDTTAQNLVAAVLIMEHFGSQLPSPTDGMANALTEARSLVEQSLKEIRTLSYVLHPPLLKEFGLLAAMKWFVRGFTERSGVNVTLETPPAMGRLPFAIEEALFRTLQEGLSNVQRHSGSKKVHATLTQTRATVTLKIRDFGTGIEPAMSAETPDELALVGVGIAGMRVRAQQLGGKLTIESTERGTTVSMQLPARDQGR